MARAYGTDFFRRIACTADMTMLVVTERIVVTPWYLQVIGNFSYFVPSDHELLILNRYDGLKNTFDSSPEKKKKKM